MMIKSQMFFIGLVFGLFAFQVGCTNKIASVSDASGLHSQRRGDTRDSLLAQKEEEIEEDVIFIPGEMEDVRESAVDEEEISQDQTLERPGANEISLDLIDVFFDYNKSSLKSDSKVALQENARKMMIHPSVEIQIAGHTDERGSNEYNLALGARRARAAKRFLVALGVSALRMKIISYGEENPFCKRSEKNCWQLNRRVHFMAQP